MRLRFPRHKFELFDTVGLDAETIKVLRALIVAVAYGIVWSNITTGVAITGYFKELGASDTLYGMVIALPAIANAFQFVCSYLLEKTCKPRKMMLISGFIQRLIWIPFALIPFIIPMEFPQLRLWGAFILALVSASMAPFMNVAFYTIASDNVPMRIRGRYFAVRTRVSTFVGLGVGLIVGVLLDRLPGYTAYAVVFTIAGVFGSLDIASYIRLSESHMDKTERDTPLLKMLLTVLKDKEYMRTVIVLTMWLFAVQVTSPYNNVYSKSVLGMSNFDIILTGQVASNLFLIILISRWGRAIDTYGNKPILQVSAFLCSLTPLMWVLMPRGFEFVQIFFANAWSGGIYCAVDLTLQNLFMNKSKPHNRSMYFAVYFLFSQLLGLALGSAVGGMLLDNVLSPVDALGITVGAATITRYNALFFIGGIMRFAIAIAVLRRLTEENAQSVPVLLSGGISHFNHTLFAIKTAHKRRRIRRRLDREEAEGRE
ncbi:MAG: MFS transporter [Clostridia bacterium]|nr:MFS transporter [Clostridia bacterium]